MIYRRITAACLAALTICVNTSPAFAKTLSKIPVVSSIVKVLTFREYTIDKKNEVLITLPSLFKDDSYVDTISENIKEQIKMRHEADDNMIYWVEGIEDEGLVELFEKISKEQNFYINSDGKLVISFDKYDVGPGYMGIQEFVIPTQIISDILVSNEYIK
ncbi:RsiV family protein [Tepidanaerobacter acetatoxydans]|uniref:RsiV family protein n=1 Tax=Tepidanaerobacter acetatoxydans TaxID=499229 RepID=UPI00235B63C8|nr:RsiV family protein [Tepidanaerobacter acetatoxydans]